MELNKEGNARSIPPVTGYFTNRIPSKIRKMSKRRQKKALKRRLLKELKQFVGRPCNQESYEDILDCCVTYLRKWYVKPVDLRLFNK